ncbi:hypothetical protein OIE69_44135 (plasmid) [Actinacidiphila glaucinigra]|uniref:hypothetical protein n=1 Tax=Actinacidiphila glaucinigra TaxID=235986 RepID=UPI002DD81E2C|nr:hypothetical protein [Actinacidiphila glaucinigra]WSD65895.1 hypothetical protein OIE69_44135 [Actinacidiphila glaucinigra]
MTTKPNSSRRPARITVASLACAGVLMLLPGCRDALSQRPSTGAVKPAADVPASNTKATRVEKLKPADIYGRATKANAEASSLRERMIRKESAYDLRISATECAGTVDMRGEGSYRIVKKGDDVWALPDENFLRVFAANGIETAEGTWLHGPADNRFMADLASFCNSKQFTYPETATTPMTKGKITKINGQEAIPVTGSVDTRSRTYFIATTGAPHLLAMKSRGNVAVGDITYSDFGTPVNATKPRGVIVEAPAY